MPVIEHREPPTEDWDYLLIDSFVGGINVDIRPGSLDEVELLRAVNVIAEKNCVLRDNGYVSFDGPMLEDARRTYGFLHKNGSIEHLGISNRSLYKWSTTNEQWELVSSGTATTVSGAHTAPDTTIAVADITGFSNGDLIAIALADGTQHITTVSGAPAAGVITITDTLPSNVSNGAALLKGVMLNGSDLIPISIETWAAVDHVYFTNGVDTPQEYDGATCQPIQNLPTTPFTCRSVVAINNMLLLSNTTENNVPFPQRVRRCDVGDPTEWSTGTAGFEDLYDSEDHILATARLGPYLIIYRQKSIVRYEYLGQVDRLFNAVRTIEDEGVMSGGAVARIGNFHFLVGTRGIYLYNGTFELQDISAGVFQRLFGPERDFNLTRRETLFTCYLPDREEVWVAYPTSTDQLPRTVLRWGVKSQKWFERVFPIYLTGFGFFTEEVGVTWDELSGAWDSQSGSWDAARAALATFQICSSTGQVYQYARDFHFNGDASIEALLEMRDFFVPYASLRTDHIALKARGTGILVEYSLDRGVTWQELKTLNPGSTFRTVRGWKQIWVPEQIRLKVTSSSSDFSLEWMGVKFRKETTP